MAKKLFKCWQQKTKLALLLAFLINMSVFAQEKYPLIGLVTIEALQQPAAGVSVIIKGTDTGTVTDFDGNYAIEVADGDILEFVYLGFKTESLIITGQKTANISLKDDTEKLDEIVVVGYGTEKKKNVTGAVSKVSGKKLTESSVARVDDALVGRVSGVQIQASNAEAGGDTKVVVRGVGSISSNSSPLVVVDGIPLGTDPDILGTIDSNTIKSVDVLKDASSTAIYGSRGANGVILVTLKEGVEGKTTFSYNTYFGIKFAEKNDFLDFDLDDFEDFLNGVDAGLDTSNPLDFVIDLKLNRGFATLEASREVADLFGGETDPQELLIPGGTITSHSFSASGGSKRVKYNASLSYLEDEGVLLEDNFEKYNGRVKVDVTSKNKKFKFGGSIAGTRTIQKRVRDFRNGFSQGTFLGPFVTQDLLDSDLIDFGDRAIANQVVFDDIDFEVGDFTFANLFNRIFQVEGRGIARNEDGSVRTPLDDGVPNGDLNLSTTSGSNILARATQQNSFKTQNSFRFSAYGEYKINKRLKVRQNIFGDTRFTRTSTDRGIEFSTELANATERTDRTDTRDHIGLETLLTYKRDIKKHSVNAVGGVGYEFFEYGRSFIDAGGFTNDATDVISFGDDLLALTLLGEETLVSAFARVNYDYDDKYIISLNARTDGSSRFAPGQQYGFFPAASIGWRVSNENFLKNSNVLTDLKLRASYGVSGSQDINSDIFLSLYRSQTLFTSVNFADEQGVKVTTLGNSELTWESLIEFNPGVDLELGNGILGLSVDYYNRTSEDLLLENPIPTVVGVPVGLANTGEVENTGFEFELRSRIINKPNFQWNVTALLSTNENEVTEFNDGQALITALDDATLTPEFITQEGGPITSFFGFVADEDLSLAFVQDPFDRPNSATGQVFVKDLNGDGVIDDDDRTVLGDPFPDFTWSLANDFQIHDFDVSFLIQGSHGAQIRDLGLRDVRQETTGDNSTQALGSGTVDGIGQNLTFADALQNAGFEEGIDFVADEVPNAQALRNRFLTSDHIQDADFVALRNVNVGYTFPSKVIEKYKFSKLRIYATGENLVFLTADGFLGFNPEDQSFTSGNANQPTTQGIQRVSLPIAKTVSVGLNLEF